MRTTIPADHRTILESTSRFGLPAPRLQITWIAINSDWSKKVAYYTLVIPLQKHDIRRENSKGEEVRSEIHLLIGETMSKNIYGHSGDSSTSINVPYRDNAHAHWDSAVLGGLPIFAVRENMFQRV